MGQLFQVMLKQCRNWSLERSPELPDCKLFSKTVTINLAIQTAAFNWLLKKPDIKFLSTDDNIVHFISSIGQPKLKECDIYKYHRMIERCSWKSFNTHTETMNRLWMLKFQPNSWEESICSCPFFLKSYSCKHIVGLASKLNLFELSAKAKTVPLGERRNRGRPAKCSKTLLTV